MIHICISFSIAFENQLVYEIKKSLFQSAAISLMSCRITYGLQVFYPEAILIIPICLLNLWKVFICLILNRRSYARIGLLCRSSFHFLYLFERLILYKIPLVKDLSCLDILCDAAVIIALSLSRSSSSLKGLWTYGRAAR